MRNKTEYINVVDIESTCWEGEPPQGEQSEIIEVGLAVIHLHDIAKDCCKRNWTVRPACSKVSEFCTQLTGLTQERVDQGLQFPLVCGFLLKNHDSKNRVWASWGDYDRKQFEKNCARYDIPYPFGSRHLNVKTLFSMMYGLEGEVGMDRALSIMNLPLQGTHHRAGDDAANIAYILQELIIAFRDKLRI